MNVHLGICVWLGVYIMVCVVVRVIWVEIERKGGGGSKPFDLSVTLIRCHSCACVHSMFTFFSLRLLFWRASIGSETKMRLPGSTGSGGCITTSRGFRNW